MIGVVRLRGTANSISHGARPVHLIITMIKWIRTSRLILQELVVGVVRLRCTATLRNEQIPPAGRAKKVDVRLPEKGNSNSHGARPVHLIVTMIKWIRTSRLSIQNSLSVCKQVFGTGTGEAGHAAILLLLLYSRYRS